MNWFDVDKQGLAKLLEARGKGFAVLELLQNAWDQNVTRVDVSLLPVAGQPLVEVTVQDDDPDGFANLAHAFTLFAESEKKADPTRRGRFNLGEKLVLACCKSATIHTTSGTVVFDETGRHVYPRRKRNAGSVFTGLMRMTREELDEAVALVHRTLPPGVATYVDGSLLPTRPRAASWTATLRTEVADAEGYMRRVDRSTVVMAYEPLPGETGTLYELGIPVVETGDRWHVNVMQKVPLTMDRENVPPAYLRAVRVGLLNALAHKLATQEEATAPWVREAAGDKDAAPAAVSHTLDLRFGAKRVAYDPSDHEANKLAVMDGYTVVSGGSLSAGEWENARQAKLVEPAGKVTPSPKPFSADGQPLRTIRREDWTPAMGAFNGYVRSLARRLISEQSLRVVLANDPQWGFGGCFGGSTLTVNVARFGGRAMFYADGPDERLLAFLIHEFAHAKVSDHLSRDFYDETCRLGAALALLATKEPSLVSDGLVRT